MLIDVITLVALLPLSHSGEKHFILRVTQSKQVTVQGKHKLIRRDSLGRKYTKILKDNRM